MSEPRDAADPRAVRVAIAPSTALDGDPTLVVAPRRGAPAVSGEHPAAGGEGAVVDGEPVAARLRRHDASRGVLEVAGPDSDDVRRTGVLFGQQGTDRDRGMVVREVVVGGWRFEVEVEPERRALLRERARRVEAAGAAGGPVEVRAIIPGRVVAVSVQRGDAVLAGQQILVVEAMKMQNELRAPREGSVERLGVAVGDTIDVGDLLVVIH